MRLTGNFEKKFQKKFQKKIRKFFFSIFSFLRAFVVSSCRKSGFRVFLSLRYGADLGRSRLVSFDFVFRFISSLLLLLPASGRDRLRLLGRHLVPRDVHTHVQQFLLRPPPEGDSERGGLSPHAQTHHPRLTAACQPLPQHPQEVPRVCPAGERTRARTPRRLGRDIHAASGLERGNIASLLLFLYFYFCDSRNIIEISTI